MSRYISGLSKILLFTLIGSISATSLLACREPDVGDDPIRVVVRESTDPETVPEDVTSVTGRVTDFFTGDVVQGAWVSTFPVSDAVRARGDGRYILERDLVPEQLYTVTAEADGFAPSSAPVLVKSGKSRNIDLPMIRTDRVMPVLLDPPVVAMPPNINRVRIEMRSESDEDASWTMTNKPDWLIASPDSGSLRAGGLQILRFALDPAGFLTALEALDAGESLLSEVTLEDERGRVARLPVLVIPANLSQISIDGTLEAGADGEVDVGDKVSVVVVARLSEAELEGAPLTVEVSGPIDGLEPRQEEHFTDDRGLSVIDLDAEVAGDYDITVRLATYPNVDPLRISLTVRPSGDCAQDNGGCGDPSLSTCVAEDGATSCVDVDECEIDAMGFTACGRATRFRCINHPSAPPTCEDIDECEVDNGGCGDARFFRCIDREGMAPDCEDIDECAVNNGGCGGAAFVRCEDQEGAPPVCVDLDACAPGADGTNACGDPAFWECTDRAAEAPDCVDVRECDLDQDGMNACGDPAYAVCVEVMGGMPTCMDTEDECATNNGGCDPTYTVCVNKIGAPHECQDIDECATNNGNCGDPVMFECVDNVHAPPTCLERDPCDPMPDGINACGVASRWTCTWDAQSGAADCQDIDECAVDARGHNECGEASRWSCSNNPGAPPTCQDVDECQLNYGGCDPLYDVCINNPGARATCDDFDECSVANGGCDPIYERCVNRVGAGAACEDLDECEPDAAGMTPCGHVSESACLDRVRQPPICTDLDECEVINGANACGDPARDFVCVNNDMAPPTCTACMPGSVNLDNVPGNGCEYQCSGAAAESCNSADDDCDGLIDEDFDLLQDRNNCGACGVVCAALPNASATDCVAGACVVVQCAPGYSNANRDDVDGCEVAPPSNGSILYVDQLSGEDTSTGAAMDPLQTIGRAVELAAAGDTIYVRAGTYTERLSLDVSGVTLMGEARDQVIIQDTQQYTSHVIKVGASDVTVSNLTVLGGATGVDVLAAADRVTLRDLNITGQRGAPYTACSSRAGEQARGVRASLNTNLNLVGVDFSSIASADGGNACCPSCAAGRGALTVALELERTSNAVIYGNTFTNIRGSSGGKGVGCNTNSGRAGDTHVVEIDRATGTLFQGNALEGVFAAIGGDGGQNCGEGDRGGVAVGVQVEQGGSNQILDNSFFNFSGGKGGASYRSRAGSDGEDVYGIRLVGADLVTVARNTFSSLTGGDRGDVETGVVGEAGSAYGIHASSVSNLILRNNSLTTLNPGARGTNVRAVCVYVDAASPASIDHLTCSKVSHQTIHEGFGVQVVGMNNSLTIENSIFDRVEGTCVMNADIATVVNVSYSNFNACSAGDMDNVTTSGFIYNEVPAFAPQPPGNTHLLPTSALIDLAAPGAPYANEPSPNGCRANLGAFGNTPEATSAPNATHCN